MEQMRIQQGPRKGYRITFLPSRTRATGLSASSRIPVAPCRAAYSAPFALMFCLLLALPANLSAEKKQAPSVEPSVGYDANAATLRGETCEVPLKAIPAHGYEIQFAIVPGSGPRHGSLSGPVRNSKGSVSYFYTHNGAKGATQDSFRFKFKSGPKKSWSYKTASISIKEPPPRLVTQSVLDFGHVFIGESRTLPLVVKNAGGGVLEAALKVGAPWELVTEPVFKLAEGESRKILIRFMPLSDDTQQGRLFFETGINSPTEIALQGIGGFRFDVPPAIAFAKEAGPGDIRLPVTNLSPEPLSLRINAPLPLEAPQTLELAPLASAELILTLPARPFTERHVLVSLGDGAAMRDVKVSLPAPPAPLEWRGESPQLGKSTAGRSRPLTATLHNLGALPATVTLAVEGDGLSLADSQPKSVEIAPDAFATVNATWRLPDRPGPATASFLATAGGISTPLRWSVDVLPSAKPPQPPALTVVATPQHNPMAQASAIPPVQEASLLEATAHSIAISWKLTSPDTKTFVVERRDISRGENGRAKEEWVPWENAQIEIEGDSATARFRKLVQNSFWMIRLRSIDNNNRLGEPSPVFRIATKKINLLQIPFWIWMPSLLAILLLAFRFLRKRIHIEIGEIQDTRRF